MERYFVISSFEDGWPEEELQYEDIAIQYCAEALDVPEEKIEEITFGEIGMEITLTELEEDDLKDDWYVNLHRICDKI